MTEDLDQAEAEQVRTPLAPRRKPPARRAQPSNGHTTQEPTLSDVLAAVNTVASSVSALERRVDQVEGGGVRYVQSEPEPLPDARAVNPDALDPFTRKLWEDRTHDTPQDYGGDREPSYNIALRLYLKNDGTYAWLQGDAKNRLYYTEKGYHCLSDDQVAEYQKLQPQIVQTQRQKAHLVKAIRDLAKTDPSLAGHRVQGELNNDEDLELNGMSLAELQGKWQALCAETTQPDRKLPPMPRFRSEGRDRNLDGVEMTPPKSRRSAFETEQTHTRSGRAIEVTQSNWDSFR